MRRFRDRPMGAGGAVSGSGRPDRRAGTSIPRRMNEWRWLARRRKPRVRARGRRSGRFVVAAVRRPRARARPRRSVAVGRRRKLGPRGGGRGAVAPRPARFRNSLVPRGYGNQDSRVRRPQHIGGAPFGSSARSAEIAMRSAGIRSCLTIFAFSGSLCQTAYRRAERRTEASGSPALSHGGAR